MKNLIVITTIGFLGITMFSLPSFAVLLKQQNMPITCNYVQQENQRAIVGSLEKMEYVDFKKGVAKDFAYSLEDVDMDSLNKALEVIDGALFSSMVGGACVLPKDVVNITEQLRAIVGIYSEQEMDIEAETESFTKRIDEFIKFKYPDIQDFAIDGYVLGILLNIYSCDLRNIPFEWHDYNERAFNDLSRTPFEWHDYNERASNEDN
ncbi:MAG: hypothetical protein P9M06_03445 [Candidatus Saelkia tenebricola]|nr:hypothetical protein [Candidatus Saelkia tenebricola]